MLYTLHQKFSLIAFRKKAEMSVKTHPSDSIVPIRSHDNNNGNISDLFWFKIGCYKDSKGRKLRLLL